MNRAHQELLTLLLEKMRCGVGHEVRPTFDRFAPEDKLGIVRDLRWLLWEIEGKGFGVPREAS